MDSIPKKIHRKIRLFYIIFQVLSVFLKNICQKELSDLLFIVAFISCYISRYYFHKFLELHSTLSEKKMKKRFTNPTSHNSQNLLGMTSFFVNAVMQCPISPHEPWCWCYISDSQFLLFFMKIENTVYTSFQKSMLLFINGLIFDIMDIQNNRCLAFEWIPM